MKTKLIPIMGLLLALMSIHCGGAEPASDVAAIADAGTSTVTGFALWNWK